MADIYPTAFAFGSDCIRGNDLGCSVIIFTGSVGGIVTPALVGLAAVLTALLLAGIVSSVVSVKTLKSLDVR